MNIIEACQHPHLFAPWFRNPETYDAWRVFLAALFGLPMTDDQLAVYQRHTGRQEPPTGQQDEAWLVIGRRGGKSFHMALIAVYVACFRDYRQHLARGERATVMVIAADRKQSRVIMRYVKALLTGIPTLHKQVEAETADSIDLEGSVTIEVGTASFRSTRGYTFAAVLADEIAFWRTDDAAEPDYAILDAVRPGMATIPGSMLLCASSPYARRGALWDAFSRYYGKDDGPLVWKATTRQMNPTVADTVVSRALERDQASASAEYLAEFRRDIEMVFPRETVMAAVDRGVRSRPRVSGIVYHAFTDPSGGGSDAFTLAIGHREGDKVVLDLVAERKPPFSPEAVIAEYAGTLKAYGVLSVEGDRYAGEFPREHFRKQGISYVVARKTRSELYGELIPMMNSGRVRLLDNDRLTAQLVGLERRTTRSGRDSIDHAPGGHDDTANAVAGVIERCAARYEASPALVGTYGYTGDPWQRQRQSQSGLWGTYGRANLERMN